MYYQCVKTEVPNVDINVSVCTPLQVATNKTDELRAGQGIWDVGKPVLELFF